MATYYITPSQLCKIYGKHRSRGVSGVFYLLFSKYSIHLFRTTHKVHSETTYKNNINLCFTFSFSQKLSSPPSHKAAALDWAGFVFFLSSSHSCISFPGGNTFVFSCLPFKGTRSMWLRFRNQLHSLASIGQINISNLVSLYDISIQSNPCSNLHLPRFDDVFVRSQVLSGY